MKYLLLSIILIFFSCNLYAEETVKVLITDDKAAHITIESAGWNGHERVLVNGVRYRGNIDVKRTDKGLIVINELPIEDYVEGVVAAEMGSKWDIEALKAQAVLARTYALYQKTASNNNGCYLTSSVLHQVYKGDNDNLRIKQAVKDTEDEVLTYNGGLIAVFYHSTSVGLTEDPMDVWGKDYPYLRPVECSGGSSPYVKWHREFPIDVVERALNLRSIKDMEIIAVTETGRAKTVRVITDDGKKYEFQATDLRKLLGYSQLPSTDFEVKVVDDTVIFDGSGYGHGVGLCQWCALEMAKQGETYREILEYFYPGTVIKRYDSIKGIKAF